MSNNHPATTPDDIYQVRKAEKEQEFLDKLGQRDYQEAIDIMWDTDNQGTTFIHRILEELHNAAYLQSIDCGILLDEMAEKWAELELDKEQLELEETHDTIFTP